MERSNVEAVFVAGQVRKWACNLLGVDVDRLRRELEASRDRILAATGLERDLFRA